RPTWIGFLSRGLRPKWAAWGWGSRFAARSSTDTAVEFGSRPTSTGAQHFNLSYLHQIDPLFAKFMACGPSPIRSESNDEPAAMTRLPLVGPDGGREKFVALYRLTWRHRSRLAGDSGDGCAPTVQPVRPFRARGQMV